MEQQHAARPQTPQHDNAAPHENPLDALSVRFDADIKSVNALIIARMASDVALVNQLAGYIIAAGGKRIRPLLTLAATALFAGEMPRAHNLAAAVEFIHTATLLHDDVVDESLERRGKATANTVFGNQASVLVGDFLFSRAFQLMVADGNLEVLRILSDASAIIAQGEVLQLSAMNNPDTPLETYIEIVSAKTAALFSAACAVGPVIAGQSEGSVKAMSDYGLNLGIAFQIADDILDYTADAQALGKTLGDDFREGKMTAPIIFAVQSANSDDERDFWQRVIAENTQSESDFAHALALIDKHNGLARAQELAQDYAAKAQNALELIPVNAAQDTAALKDTLRALIDFSIRRLY
ncbi:MAG: polyprenyl synthetase family protein [Alphaproteobacteria bacterium]